MMEKKITELVEHDDDGYVIWKCPYCGGVNRTEQTFLAWCGHCHAECCG